MEKGQFADLCFSRQGARGNRLSGFKAAVRRSMPGKSFLARGISLVGRDDPDFREFGPDFMLKGLGRQLKDNQVFAAAF